MKIALREWMKHPQLMGMMLLKTLLASVDIYLGIQATRLLASFFDYRDVNIIIMLGCLMAASLIVSLFKKWMSTVIHKMFTVTMDSLANKVLEAEYNMFIEFSCSRVISITESIFNIVGSMDTLQNMSQAVVQMILLIIAISKIIPGLTVPVVVVYGIGAVVLRLVYNYWNTLDKKADELKRERNIALSSSIEGFKEVRGFSTEEIHRKDIFGTNHNALGCFLKRQHSSILITGIYHIIYISSTLIGLYYCMNAINSGKITIAFAMVIMTYVEQIGNPIEILLDLFDILSNQLSRIDEFDKFMKYENTHTSNGNIKFDKFENAIQFENVCFAYDNKRGNVLKDFNMTIKKGSHVGICGASGGGKSTMFNLLMGYYTPQSGKISIDGIDYNMLDMRSLRKHIGILNQDVYTFDNTIWYNITYGKPDASRKEVIRACKNANIYDFIMELPEKFETKVGPRGLELSGGQKQRIALARLFLVNPEIILLDEATAALDNESEEIIHESLSKFKGKTTITIAHRLSTIRDSDIIYVINDQKVAEAGTHKELMKLGGIYAGLNKKRKKNKKNKKGVK